MTVPLNVVRPDWRRLTDPGDRELVRGWAYRGESLPARLQWFEDAWLASAPAPVVIGSAVQLECVARRLGPDELLDHIGCAIDRATAWLPQAQCIERWLVPAAAIGTPVLFGLMV